MTIQASNTRSQLQFTGQSHHYTASKVNSHFRWFVSTATRTDAEPTYACVVSAFRQSNGSVRYTLFTNHDALSKARTVNSNTSRYKLSAQLNSLAEAKEWVNNFNKTGFKLKSQPEPTINNNDTNTNHTLNINS